MNFLRSLALRPYYFNHSKSYKLFVSLGFGTFVFLFLFIFKPFDIPLLGDNMFIYVLSLGLITAGGLLFNLFILPLVFKQFFESENWVVGKNVLFTIWMLVFVGSLNWYYNLLITKNFNPILDNYYSFLFYTVTVGVLPIILFFIIDEKVSRIKRQKFAKKIRKSKQKDIKQKGFKNIIKLKSASNKEELIIDVNNLVYLTSEGNYICVFTNENGALKERILRTTLTKATECFTSYTNIIRCHKSYIINSNFIKDIEGNARGYVLKSDSISFEVPVSRSFSKDLLKTLVGKS